MAELSKQTLPYSPPYYKMKLFHFDFIVMSYNKLTGVNANRLEIELVNYEEHCRPYFTFIFSNLSAFIQAKISVYMSF